MRAFAECLGLLLTLVLLFFAAPPIVGLILALFTAWMRMWGKLFETMRRKR
jgi:hypothetical protein